MTKKSKLVPANMTYIDKAENLLRIPDVKTNKEEHKIKKKMPKKSAKRTIQKIIKKKRAHKRICLNFQTSVPTKPPINGDSMDSLYAKEEMSPRNENSTTTQVKEKKKHKWNTKVARYPMPFQKLQSMKEHRRNRRSNDRDDLFLLTDLDEIEFLDNTDKDKDKDTNIVNAHVKKYW